jgi:AcrR family transcriptional regulator
MARDGEPTRQRILKAAYRCFYREGFFRVSVDAVAAAAKVTKKTLYYHFPSKDALAGAVLDEHPDDALRLIEASLPDTEVDAGKAVRSIFDAFARWAARPHWCGSGFTRISMELAELPGHPARVAARRHKRTVETVLATRLASCGVKDAEVVARQVALLIEGANTLMLIHGDTGYAASAGAAAEQLVGRKQRRRRFQ